MQSPKPVVVDAHLNLFQALEQVSQGKKIAKLEWGKSFHVCLQDSKLQLIKPDNKAYDWVISDGDLAGTDYIVIQ
jgi:hypothetical protein